jgi:hypothetical protein
MADVGTGIEEIRKYLMEFEQQHNSSLVKDTTNTVL